MNGRAVRHRTREFAAWLLSRLPRFRGKGRITLPIDALLTDSEDPRSYITEGSLNGGRRFSFDLRAWGQKFAFYYSEWEREHVEAMRRLYHGGVFLDIGSSIGLYAVSLGDEVRQRNGSIISFEPVAMNSARQRRNLRLNDLESIVTLLEIGLGSRESEAGMTVDPTGADNNAIIGTTGTLMVPIRRLDDVMVEMGSPHVTLIKMDVEGYEPEVIAGGHDMFRQRLPALFAEFSRERMRINGFAMDGPWNFLMSCGYRCYRLVNGRFQPIESPEEFQDLYFIPPSFGDPNSRL